MTIQRDSSRVNRSLGAMVALTFFTLSGQLAGAQETRGNEARQDDPRISLELANDQFRMSGGISNVAVSPAGDMLVAIARNEPVPTAWLIDEPTGKLVETIKLPPPATGWISTITFSPDGKQLLWGELHGSVALWSVPERRLLFREKLHNAEVQDVEFSATGKLFASAGADGFVHARQANDPGTAYRRLEPGGARNRNGDGVGGTAGISTIVFTPDEEVLIAGMGGQGKILTWQLANDLAHVTDAYDPRGSHNPVLLNLAVTPDGKSLMSAGQRTVPRSETSLAVGPEQVTMAEIYFWDLHTGERLRDFQHPDWYSFGNATLSPDGKRIALAEFSRLQILDAETGERVRSFDLPGEWGAPPHFSPDSRRVYMPLDNSIGVFEVESGMLLGDSGTFPRGYFHSLASSPDRKQIATGHGDGYVRVWDANAGQLVWSELLAPVISRRGWDAWPMFVSFTPDQSRLVAAGRRDAPVDYREGIVVVFDAATGQRLREIIFDVEVRHAALSPDGKHIVVATSKGNLSGIQLQAIDITTGEVAYTFPADEAGGIGLSSVEALGFAPNGLLLVSVDDGETLALDGATGEIEQRFVADARALPLVGEPPLKRLQIWRTTFSADGSTFVANSAKQIQVWDMASGTLRQAIPHPHDHGRIVAASPDGQTIATADLNYAGDPGDNIIRLFDTESGREIGQFEKPGHRARLLEFSADGRQLVAGFHNGSVTVWDLPE